MSVFSARPATGTDEQCVSECVSELVAAVGNLFDQSLHLIPVYFQELHGHFSHTLSPLCTAKAFPLNR